MALGRGTRKEKEEEEDDRMKEMQRPVLFPTAPYVFSSSSLSPSSSPSSSSSSVVRELNLLSTRSGSALNGKKEESIESDVDDSIYSSDDEEAENLRPFPHDAVLLTQYVLMEIQLLNERLEQR